MALFDDASLVVTPNGYKAGTLYSIKPTSGAGDMTVVRATTATRVNSAGLIESVANNVPRLDYSNGSCPSLLVEPQRTNSATYSEQFNNAAWNKLNTTVVANNAISPDGTTSADLVYPTTTGTDRLIEQVISATTSQIWTSSFFVKASGFSWVLVYSPNLGACWFNASTGVFGTIAASVTATVLGQVNGYWRISFTGTLSSNNSYFYAGTADANGSTTSTASGTNGIHIWGAQLEQGSYPTSYIPTTSAAVTRNADVISKTGISSLIGQTEGVMFLDTYIDNIASQTNDPVLFYLRGVAEVYIEIASTGRVYGVFYNGTTSTGFINANIGLQNGRHKMAFGYKDNDFVLYVDGTQVGTDTSGLVSGSLTEFGLQYYQNTYQGTQDINSAILFPTRLTNAELASLTTI